MSVELMNGVLKAITLKVSAQTISAQYFNGLNGGSGVLHTTVKLLRYRDRII